jgi:3-phenylpropionate/trans-cinnamate dioxygenase ferredoxin subunit
VPEGGHIVVSAGRREIGVFRIDGAFYALLNRCPHLGGPLCVGQVVTDVVAPVPGDVRASPERVFVTCPWHNWEFDIKTGQSYWNARLRALPFRVAVEDGQTVACALDDASAQRVAGPYMAETVPVSVEDQFLVVHLRTAKTTAEAEG